MSFDFSISPTYHSIGLVCCIGHGWSACLAHTFPTQRAQFWDIVVETGKQRLREAMKHCHAKGPLERQRRFPPSLGTIWDAGTRRLVTSTAPQSHEQRPSLCPAFLNPSVPGPRVTPGPHLHLRGQGIILDARPHQLSQISGLEKSTPNKTFGLPVGSVLGTPGSGTFPESCECFTTIFVLHTPLRKTATNNSKNKHMAKLAANGVA